MRQIFALWFVPFYKANVTLVVVIRLAQLPNSEEQADEASIVLVERGTRFYIVRQEDHYQVDEFIKFLLPGLGPLFVLTWQLCSTLLCIVGCIFLIWPWR